MQSFNAEIENQQFKLTTIFDIIASVVDVVTIRCRADGIYLRTMDPSHVLLMDVFLSKNDFTIYNIEFIDGSSEIPFRVNLTDINRFFKYFNKPTDTTQMWLNMERNKLMFKVRRKTFDISLLTEDEEEEIPNPLVDFNVRIRVKNEEIKDDLKFAEKFGEYITFTATDGTDLTLTLETSGDAGDMHSEIILDTQTERQFIKGTQTAIYSMEYIIDMFKPTMDTVEIQFSTEMPILVSYWFSEHSRITFMLAPRVEEEEEEEEWDAEEVFSDLDDDLEENNEPSLEQSVESLLQESQRIIESTQKVPNTEQEESTEFIEE